MSGKDNSRRAAERKKGDEEEADDVRRHEAYGMLLGSKPLISSRGMSIWNTLCF